MAAALPFLPSGLGIPETVQAYLSVLQFFSFSPHYMYSQILAKALAADIDFQCTAIFLSVKFAVSAGGIQNKVLVIQGCCLRT